MKYKNMSIEGNNITIDGKKIMVNGKYIEPAGTARSKRFNMFFFMFGVLVGVILLKIVQV